ncbi:IS3 family transposase [Dankookia sp. GCM10030260]|uniref:IS3 family transposase n=1 Tax=Dankookia sp. GCM10030260 TaxID=3273390 RepID=UPI0036136695
MRVARWRSDRRSPPDSTPDAPESAQARQKRRFERTTDSHHVWPVAPGLLDQEFTAAGPDETRAADISSIRTKEGWLYLAVVIDLFARREVGWSTRDQLYHALALAALRDAVVPHRPAAGLIHHADHGVQFAARRDRKRLQQHGMLCSMSRKGDRWDNAPMESLHATLKGEFVEQHDCLTRDEARAGIVQFLEGWYNRRGLHSALGRLTAKQKAAAFHAAASAAWNALRGSGERPR